MSASISARRKGVAAAAAGALLLAGGVAATNGESLWEKIHGGDAESLHEFVKEHPHLNTHSAAIAFVREKLEKGGEAQGEILNGPAQQDYEDRAFPRTSIAPAQSNGAKAAFAKIRGRGKAGHAQTDFGSWSSVGPSSGYVPGDVTYTGNSAFVSGRTTSLAALQGCTPSSCTVFAGTAGGGVWRTTDPFAADPTWQHIGDDIPSTAIGTVYVAPDDSVYVGTGEQNGSSDSEAGRGLYRSTDGGAHFTKVSTDLGGQDFTTDRAVGAVVVDPTNPGHLFVGTEVARHGASSVNGGRYTPPDAATLALYESTDGGKDWAIAHQEAGDPVDGSSATGNDYFRGGVSSVKLDPTDPRVVYATFDAYGLFRRDAQGTWTEIYKTPFSSSTSSRVEFAPVAKDGKTRIYLGDATRYDNGDGTYSAGFLRTDDAATVTPDSWTLLSNPTKGTSGYGSYNFCQGQCSYDIAVTVSPSDPDVVYLSGSMNYDELFAANQPSNGRAVIRSTDAGVDFTDMTNDVSNNGLHPDQHALLVIPGGDKQNETFFTGADGGVVRQSGPFVDKSADCDTRGLTGDDLADCKAFLAAIPTTNKDVNKGLQTLQFQSVSVAGGKVMGGTQDNGTWNNDGPDSKVSGWFESVGGDGGQSGFDAVNSNIRYHSYYAPQHDVNFHGSNPQGWDWISDPLINSHEGASFYTPLTADPVVGGTVFDGLQHVWRTTDNGGPRGQLDKHCNEFTGDFTVTCGDWKPLGGSALNAPGDLSGTAYGTDNAGAGNYVVAIARPTSDRNTLWAGTRRGRLFVSSNAGAADPNKVTYTRIDQALGLPTRFISGIAVDPRDPNHIWVSYSGYSAYAAGGHVYEIHWNPRAGKGKVTDLSGDLGDQPITSIARTRSGALVVGTDFGVAVSAGDGHWTAAGSGLPSVAVYGLTLDGSTLYAATHGRGLWKLDVS